ncbi:P-loop containing nucleoside triphosphate hydrolase, Protein Cms1 [Heracleum sosnowskyi]|uniref:P-loop containing nucleoside triphosphate hydrolase, Protein Cms1 n=1 Tax=Heracleum sosnowskyi TaxID=360622 RepID=A0AAD8I8S4_9APIA|nr:P-loop containing nucleoside triphosphate hydrolase, Protein Cms1 [Heracleum sosnowskyi]
MVRGDNQKPKFGKHKKPVGPNKPISKKTNKIQTKTKNNNNVAVVKEEATTPSQHLSFFLNHFQSTNRIQLSSLELDSIQDSCIVELPQGLAQDASTLSEHIKTAFGQSWRHELCDKEILQGKIEPGNPALLVVSLSALRSLELYRGLKPFSTECPVLKLFSKHIKVQDQVSSLKNRVNIASGTPSRIKKLIDMEVLGLSRLQVIVLDMHTDVKGYSLLSLPQIRDEFWELYKCYFHQRVVDGDLRICLYGPIPVIYKGKKNIIDK